jgi:GntR family transcriptional regulator, vanillate catabolism transcriptional regulator
VSDSANDRLVLPTGEIRRTRLVEDVSQQLRDLIISGELQPGTQLLQTELAEKMGVSRTPLREAFRILENDGLIRIKNKNRTVEVVTITSADLAEMYQIREVIDGLAARLAAQRGLPAEVVAELRRLIAEMRAAADPYDPARRTAAHINFHALIAEHCGNEHVQAFIPLIRASSAALYLPFIEHPSGVRLMREGHMVSHAEVLEAAQSFHDQILDAIVARDPKKAEQVARRHIALTLKSVPDLDAWRAAIAEAAGVQSA